MHSVVYLFLIFSVFGAKIYIDEQHPNIVDISVNLGPTTPPSNKHLDHSKHQLKLPIYSLLTNEKPQLENQKQLKFYDKIAYTLSPLQVSISYPPKGECSTFWIKEQFNNARFLAIQILENETTNSENQCVKLKQQKNIEDRAIEPLVKAYRYYCEKCERKLSKKAQEEIDAYGNELLNEIRNHYAQHRKNL
jgi:Fe2+ transport system protein B